MSASSEVALLAATMSDGETRRHVCPFCLGGSSHEKSFNITVDNGVVLWKCHRASCDPSASSGGSGGKVIRITQPRSKRPKEPWSGELFLLPPVWEEFLKNKIGWTSWHIDLAQARYAAAEHRVAFPILGPSGVRRGWVLRSYDLLSKRKALTHMDCDEPHLSWYRPNNTPHVVVVEDIPSAVRVAKYTDAVAINGGGLGPEYAHEIASHYKRVVWALDADATVAAIRLHSKYGVLFDSSTVLTLEEDFKDMSEASIKEYLQ